MKIQVLKLLFLVVVVSALTFGCGGGKEQSDAAETAEKTAPPKAEKSPEMSPADLGQKIADVYEKAMTDLTEMLKDKPAVDEVQSDVEALKEDSITKLVELGKLREALDEAGRAKVDLQTRLKANSLYSSPIWEAYNDIHQHYFQEREFHKIIASFNIITQYASFDLLKKQEPEEAQRLGIQ